MTCQIVTLETLRRRRFLNELRAFTQEIEQSAARISTVRMAARLRALNTGDVEARR